MSEDYIQYIEEYPYLDDWYDGKGWYWADETWMLNGPYDTYEDASAAQIAYAAQLQSCS